MNEARAFRIRALRTIIWMRWMVIIFGILVWALAFFEPHAPFYQRCSLFTAGAYLFMQAGFSFLWIKLHGFRKRQS